MTLIEGENGTHSRGKRAREDHGVVDGASGYRTGRSVAKETVVLDRTERHRFHGVVEKVGADERLAAGRGEAMRRWEASQDRVGLYERGRGGYKRAAFIEQLIEGLDSSAVVLVPGTEHSNHATGIEQKPRRHGLLRRARSSLSAS